MAYIFIAFYQFGVKSNKNGSCRLTRGITTYMFVNKGSNEGYSISVHSLHCKKWLLALPCLSIHLEQLGYHWTVFHEIWYLRIVQKSVEKIQVWLKADKNNRCFTWRPMYIYDNRSLNSSYNEKFFRQIWRKSHNTHFVFNKPSQKIVACVR